MTITSAYDLSVLAVALWGFTALLLTGEFNPAVILACFAMSAWAFATRRKKRNPVFWNLLTSCAFAVAVVISRENLLNASVYFFMYLQIAKLFNNKSPADTRWIYIVAFFNIIGSAVLTTSLGFALIFLIYILLMSGSLVFSNLMRQAQATDLRFAQLSKKLAGSPAINPAGIQRTLISRGILGSTTLTTVLVIATSLWFFTIVPRLSTQRLFQDYGKPPGEVTATSGFEESIEFGALQKIELSNAVAMYVRPFDSQPPPYVRMRGVALDTFDGKRWRRTTTVRQSQFPRPPFAPFSRMMYPELRRYSVIQPPGVTNFLFGDTFPESLQLEFNQYFNFDPLSNSVWLPVTPSKEMHYAVTSRIERVDSNSRKDPATNPTFLQNRTERTSGPLGAQFNLPMQYGFMWHGEHGKLDLSVLGYLRACSQLPQNVNTTRVKELADEWTKDEKTTFSKAMRIENLLKTAYTYSLEPKSRENFIEDFLFNSKEGHCEYFASSMAIMLRTQGIPSRIVNGFYSAEWNKIGKAFIVRQRDAHSWVEAYLGERYGWMTFDPTPSAGVGRMEARSAIAEVIIHFTDAIKIRWYRYVIDYDFSDQMGALRGFVVAANYVFATFDRIQAGIVQSQAVDPQSYYLSRSMILAVGFVLLFLGIIAVGLWFRSSRFMLARSSPRRGTRMVIKFYGEILKQLSRRGYRKPDGQTPLEFSRVISNQTGLNLFPEVTEHYYHLRFSGDPAGETESSLVKELLAQVKTLPRKGRSRSKGNV